MTLPILFLHAYPLDASMWEAQIAAFPERRCLAPHLPGFGGRPHGPPSLNHFADAVLGDMDRAGIDQVVLVGLSMGGYLAFRLVAHRPERFAALLLADTRAGADDEAGRKKRSDQAARARGEGTGWLAEALLPVALGETTRSERPEVVRWVRSAIDRTDPEGVARALEAMRDRPDSRGLLPTIRVPVLALAGEEDTLTPPSEARAIAEAVPGGRFLTIPGAGHLSNLENPSAFNDALASLLEDPAIGSHPSGPPLQG